MKRGGNSEPSWKAVACVLQKKEETKKKRERMEVMMTEGKRRDRTRRRCRNG